MQNKSTSRNFNPMSVPGLSSKAREAVSSVFDSMSEWRNEIAAANEKNGKQALDKMAAAAAALGWPEQIVDAAHAQMKSISEMQIRTMDQIMDAWEEQLKSPNPMSASPATMLSRFKSLPGGPPGDWPSPEALQAAAMAPLQVWVEFGKQWQKFWTDAMSKTDRG
jgi:hypothetical protein